MRFLYRLCLLILTLQAYQSFSRNLPDPESRGVWVTGDYLKGGPGAIESLIRSISKANFNIIYVNTWYRGSTVYQSDVVQNAGGPRQNPDFAGTDPLRTTIDIAHKYGIEVFAWFEYGFAVGHSSDSTQVPPILQRHPDWSMTQRDTSKHFDHDIYGYFFWLDPAVPAAADFMVELYAECARKYPDLDGIELDRMRYPNTNFSYSETSRQLYKAYSGVDPLSRTNEDTSWAKWRRQQVTNVVRRIYQQVKAVNPNCILSGAVVPPYMMAGQSQDKLQEWDLWADSGYVDLLEPMMYMTLSDFKSSLPSLKYLVPNNFYLYPGIARFAAGRMSDLVEEINYTRQLGWQGEIIWYYGALQSRGALDSLKSLAYLSKTSPSHDDLVVDDMTSGAFSKKGSWTSFRGGYRGTYSVSKSSTANSATYTFRILRSGNYSLYGFWSGDSNSNCKSVAINIVSGSFSKVDTVDQSKNLNTWNFIDNFSLTSGDTVSVTIEGTGNGDVVADAFRLRRSVEFQLEDYAVADSDHVLLKFTKNLLNPPASSTRIYLLDTTASVGFFIDSYDNSVLHVTLSPLRVGRLYNMRLDGLVSVDHDTLNLIIPIVYDPDSTVLMVDDATPLKFRPFNYPWFSQYDSVAVGGSYRVVKLSTPNVRAQWGSVTILKDGFYDIYATIPANQYPLSSKCLYIVLSHFGTDSVLTSQQNAVGGLLKLGSFEYRAGDQAAVMVSSVAGADTNQYLVADAITFRRTVNITAVDKKESVPKTFRVSQNYPNPFNSATVISFSLPEISKVYISVFNSLGEKVLDLRNGEIFQPGEWKIRFDAFSLPSGVYFVVFRIHSGSHVVQRAIKVSLIK